MKTNILNYIVNKFESISFYREEINKCIQEYSDIYDKLDLYIVHVFYVGPMDNNLNHRVAMFDSYPEASIWYNSMITEYYKQDIPLYILLV